MYSCGQAVFITACEILKYKTFSCMVVLEIKEKGNHTSYLIKVLTFGYKSLKFVLSIPIFLIKTAQYGVFFNLFLSNCFFSFYFFFFLNT